MGLTQRRRLTATLSRDKLTCAAAPVVKAEKRVTTDQKRSHMVSLILDKVRRSAAPVVSEGALLKTRRCKRKGEPLEGNLHYGK
jgi:hypothetical protein